MNAILDAYFENLERRFLTGQRIERKSIDDARGFADRHLRPHVGELVAEDVTKNCIEQLRLTITRTPKAHGGGDRSLSGIQAPLRILRAAYRFALECEPPLISRMPKIHTVSETHRVRHGYFPEHEIPVILPYFDESTRVAIAVALDAGLRSIKELLDRRWEDIDWENSLMWVPADSAKNDEARQVPIRPETMEMLAQSKRLRDERFPNCPWVFFWRERRGRGEPGQRIASVYQQFKDAMKRAAKDLKRPELAQRVPHDCRRSFVTNLSLKGELTDVEIAKMSGHKDLSVFQRYKVPGRDAARIAATSYKRNAQEKAGAAAISGS